MGLAKHHFKIRALELNYQSIKTKLILSHLVNHLKAPKSMLSLFYSFFRHLTPEGSFNNGLSPIKKGDNKHSAIVVDRNKDLTMNITL